MRAELAARNNAQWCDLVCRYSGVPGRFAPDAWTAPRRTLLYYPDAVTLVPSVSAESLLARIDTTSPGCSVKDSFADLDLTRYGFRVLFEAVWLYRPAGPAPVDPVWPAGPLPMGQAPVDLAPVDPVPVDPVWPVGLAPVGPPWPVGLAPADPAWSVRGDRAGLPPGLADDPAVRLIGGPHGGAVAYRGAGGVGLSHVSADDGDLDAVWRGCLAIVAREFPGLPAVGYEHGPALDAALRQGFRRAGGLRVWIADG